MLKRNSDPLNPLSPSIRREKLKQRRMAIEQGEIPPNKSLNKTLFNLEKIGWSQRLIETKIKIWLHFFLK